MKAYPQITELIGATPLVRLNRLSPEGGATIYAKVESFNPGGSVKDRICLNMINEAEREGRLKPGGTIVEPTSGNTGIGLALVSAVRGYKLILVMPESMSMERASLLSSYGAQLVLTAAWEGMKGSIKEAEGIVAQNPSYFMPDQFSNPANPAIHRRTTAVEIWDALDGRLDAFVAAVGTGGTITGCGEVFKERNRQIKVIAVEPSGSPVLSGGDPGPHKIQGIGAGFIPDTLDLKMVDRVELISNEESIDMARRLASQEGILCGISCGAAVAVAVRIAREPEMAGKTIVVVLPDSGERYLSSVLFEGMFNE